MSFNNARKTPLATTRTVSLVCPKCGIIKKSGKKSCCGRDGSWFGKCGAAGKAKLPYKWSDGLLACEARSQFNKFIGEQVHGAQSQSNHHSDDTGSAHSKAVIAAPNTFLLAPVKMPTPMLEKTPVITPPDMSTNASINVPTTMSMRTSTKSPAPMAGLADTMNFGAMAAAFAPIISAYTNISTPTVPLVNVSIEMVAPTSMTATSTGGLVAVSSHHSASTSITARRCQQACLLWSIVFHVIISAIAVFECQFV